MDPRQRGPWPDDPRRRPPGEEGEMRGGGFPPPRGPPPNHWERGPPPGNNDRGGPPFRGPPGGPPGRGPPPGEFRGRGGLPGGRAGPPGGRGPPPPPFERGPPGPRDFGPRGNDGNAEYFVPLGRGPGDDFRPNDRPRGPPPQNSPGLRGHSSEPSLHHRSPPMGNNVPGRDEFGRDEFGRNRPPPGLRGPGPPAGPPGGGGRGRGRGSHVNKPAWMAQQERLTPPPRNDMPRNDMPRNDMPRSPPRDNFFPRGHNSMPSMPGQGRSAFEERRAPSPGGPPQSFERNDFQRPPPGEFQRPPPGEFQRPPPQSFDRPPLSRPEDPEPAPVKSEEEPPQPDDEEYTASLRLLTTDIEKRPIDLPSDVEHITDVEWAEDDPSKDSGGTHSAKSMVTALEKAPRPKANRPEPCFCEPDLDTEAVCCTDTNCALFACQEECPSNCPAGPLCGNKRIQKKQWKPFERYVGVAVKKRYLDNLFTRYKHERMLYIMALDNDVYIDARHRGGIARYINHSCEPNCIVHRWKVRGILRAGVFALKEIREGEELSFDYQWERKRGRALTKCHCGAPTCRGTLEMEKDPDAMEHEDEMEEMDGDWLDPPPNPGREIMNRVVKVFFPKEDVHYVADVAQYDEKAKRHLLMYRGDPEEHWTDLTQEEWMILDNAGESYAITRKHLGIKAPDGATLSSGISTPRSDHSRSSSPLPPGKAKNCIYIQTPIKEAMATKHTLFKCGRYHRIAVPEGEHATEKDEDLKKAFAESKDGVVWKLHITGLDVQKAVEWLEKIHASIREELDGGTALEAVPDGKVATELIIPRIIIDAVNKRFYSLKGYCYNTEVSYTHSDSKLEADEKIYVERSREYLNTELTKMCLAAGAPMTSIGVYKDYGFLGGTLTSADYQLLFQRERSPNKGATADCSEDFSGNNFAQAFMETNRCTIWVQAEEDMGRVKDNVVINESYSNKPRKIFFGVTPSRVAKLWDDLVNRVNDLRRGVQFFHLGANKIYLPTMLEPIKRNGRAGCNYFFEFIKMTCGAIVTVDRITGSSHLRIDGGDASIPGKEEKVNERIDTAMELIQLQIELLRDHHIRKQRWGFGRDWALLLDNHLKSTGPVDPKTAEASSSSQDLASLASSKPANTSADSLRLSDPRAIGTACLEISEIVTVSGLSEKVAAHAVIIFYRYLNLVQQPSDGDNSNGVGYESEQFQDPRRSAGEPLHRETSPRKSFYPGSYFNKESEEAKNWERRVIKAEQTLLAALNYDVFWPGVDWVVNAVVGKKAMGGPLAENTMALALSGHYGPKYAFAAIAGFLSIDIEPLFPALSLHPLTVSHAAELIYHSCQALSKMKKTIVVHSKHELFSDAKGINDGHDDSGCPERLEISERAKLRRVFPDVRAECIEEKVLPVLGKICFESKCTVRFSDGMAEGTNDIVLEGAPDQIVAMTSNASSYSALGGASAQRDRPPPGEGNVIKQVKVQPGLLEMKEIDGKLGWYGTSDSSQTYDAGWKTCMAANAPQEHLDSAGLRWWVPHQYGPSLSGSLCEIFTCPKLIDQGKVDMRALALLAQSFAGGAGRPRKVEIKERSTSGQSMQMGYSVAALQEMQLLHQLHFLIPSPQGHPNFILPLAIALDADHNVHDKESGATNITPNKAASDILAMIERNQRSAGKRQVASGSHLVLEPTPLNIQKVMSRYQKKNNEGKAIPPAVLASWAHDILSAISFCHSNHIVLRSLLPDQIHLDHSGNAKLSGLSKVMVLHGKDRTKFFNPRKYVREKKGKDHNTEDVEPFAAPELLLGGTRHTKETDMWAFGALLANLLLGRQLFPGKDRVSKMTQVFKIVGVPSADNYEEAKKFPFHSNNMYVIGEEGKKKNAEQEFSGLIGLIDGMLHLDPKRRMTADDALRHQYMVNHSMQIERPEFRQNYVTNWLDLKETVLTKGKSPKSTLFDAFAQRPAEQIETPVNGAAEKEMKRKAFLIGASAGADGDDLYNLDDILGSPDLKKPKL
ncbi:hypothetical protein ACHAXT_002446 [Thalassiosira profunda]